MTKIEQLANKHGTIFIEERSPGIDRVAFTFEELQSLLNEYHLPVEDRYDELHYYARKVLLYNGVDAGRFEIALKQLDTAIQRHMIEIGDEE